MFFFTKKDIGSHFDINIKFIIMNRKKTNTETNGVSARTLREASETNISALK
tara:strand:+ start:834 stop:989 length:156 start_codon:yes stop_codon:yes gene_type:complete